MQITHDSKFITLIGLPLAQSYAARMQNAAYEAMGADMAYMYNEADEEHLRQIIDGIRYMPSFAGAAVTKPNKMAVIEYLDETDPICAAMGACNTVVKQPDGKLKGYNTDAMGFMRSFREEAGIDPKGKKFFCIGGGGAARAICCALADAGAASIVVTDVIVECAASLVADLNENFAPIAQRAERGDFSLVPEADVVINACGIGMGSTVGQSPLPEEYFSADQFYFDACYNPAKTRFLELAEERGARILNGLGMSLYQGAAQIELWLGQDAPVELMRSELQAILAEGQAR